MLVTGHCAQKRFTINNTPGRDRERNSNLVLQQTVHECSRHPNSCRIKCKSFLFYTVMSQHVDVSTICDVSVCVPSSMQSFKR